MIGDHHISCQTARNRDTATAQVRSGKLPGMGLGCNELLAQFDLILDAEAKVH
jgi:hypothetical protein